MAGSDGRIRVLFVSGYSDLAGGGQVSLLLLLKHLDRGRFIPLLLSPDEGEVACRARRLGIEAQTLALGRSIDTLSAVRHSLTLRRVAEAADARIVHCDTLYTAVMCGTGLLGLRIPIVFHARSAETGGILDTAVSRLCSAVICVSRATARRFSEKCPGKVHVIYNGADLEEFAPVATGSDLRDRLGIARQAFVVGYAGQLLRSKGLDVLIDAFAELHAEFADSHLLFVGRGSDEAALREAAGEGVCFLPFSDSLPDFYRALDVFALPTDFREGLSRSLIESMACAIPSVATPLGGNAETVVDGETGFFVPPRDPRRLHERLRELHLAPELRRRMGAAARGRAETHFDAAACARGVEALYRRLCP